MTRSSAFIWLLLFWLPSTSYAGEIRSHVTITQGLTKKRVTLPAYQLRGAPVKLAPPASISVNELSRVVIYLEGRDLKPGKPLHLEMKQQNREFDPDILVLPIGSTVSFPNADPIFHNVFSLSKAKAFDLGYFPSGQTRTLRFDNAGIAQVYCHLHPNMSAAIVVVTGPWFGQPEADGNLVFSDVPAGDYKVVAWHKSAGFLGKRIRVPQTGSIDIELPVPLLDKKAE
jgi:plastocyanin